MSMRINITTQNDKISTNADNLNIKPLMVKD